MTFCVRLLPILLRTSTQVMYPLFTGLATDGIPVAVTCRVLKFGKQGYYRWKTHPVT